MPSQSDDRLRRLLFCCLMNRARSPTAEWEARLAGFDADSAGTEPGAVVELTDSQLRWADLILCMDRACESHLRRRMKEIDPGLYVPVIDWHITDDYNPGDPGLVAIIRQRLKPLQALKHMIPGIPAPTHHNPRATSAPPGPLAKTGLPR